MPFWYSPFFFSNYVYGMARSLFNTGRNLESFDWPKSIYLIWPTQRVFYNSTKSRNFKKSVLLFISEYFEGEQVFIEWRKSISNSFVICREDMEKVNIVFHNNGTVTYQHKKILHFVPEMSRDGNLKVMVPNIPLLVSWKYDYIWSFS